MPKKVKADEQQTRSPKSTYTIREAAEYLSCHHRTVRTLIHSGKLRAFSLTASGKPCLRITKEALLDYIKQCHLEPSTDPFSAKQIAAEVG